MPRYQLSRIVILDSLRARDTQTGRRLHEDIDAYNLFYQRGLRVDRLKVASGNELWSSLVAIERDATTRGEYPALHIECHGSADTTGLVLANDDFVAWAALKPQLTAINVATRCNLFITLAACHGAHLLKIVEILERAPCAGIVGPTTADTEINALHAYTAFYTTLLATGDGNQAFAALQLAMATSTNYLFISAESCFRRAYTDYLRTACTPQAYWARARQQRQTLRADGIKNPPSIQDIQQRYRRKERPDFDHFSEQFFMSDLYPENRERVRYEDIVSSLRRQP